MQGNQIKGKCQLRDLSKSIEFYNEKSDKLGRDNRKKGENQRTGRKDKKDE